MRMTKPYIGQRRRIRHDEMLGWRKSMATLKQIDRDFHPTVLQYWGRAAWFSDIPRCVFARRRARDTARMRQALARYAPITELPQ